MGGLIKTAFGGFWGAIHCVLIVFWLASLDSDLPEAAEAGRVLLIMIVGLGFLRFFSTLIWRQCKREAIQAHPPAGGEHVAVLGGQGLGKSAGAEQPEFERACPHCGSTRYPVKLEVGS